MMNDLVRRVAAVGLKGTAAFHPTNHCRAISSRSSLFGGHPCEKPALRSSTSPALGALHQPREVQRLFSTSLNAEDHATNSIVTDGESGKQYGVLLDTRKLPKLKPGIVQKRLANCKKYIGNEKSIRQSPWKLNRVCQLAAGLALEEALTQLQYCDIKNSDLVAKVLKRTSNLADIRDGLQMSQLEVAECFTTKSMMLKRVKPMGRGRAGVMHHKFSNIRVVLREIDFPLRIYQQKSLNQKKKWLMHQQRAEQDAKAAKAKREEMKRLEKQEEEQRLERKAAQAS